MKKILLSLGAVGAITSPLIAVVACGSKTTSSDQKAVDQVKTIFTSAIDRFEMSTQVAKTTAETALNSTAFAKLGSVIEKSGQNFTFPTGNKLQGATLFYQVPTTVDQSNPNGEVSIIIKKNQAQATIKFDIEYHDKDQIAIDAAAAALSGIDFETGQAVSAQTAKANFNETAFKGWGTAKKGGIVTTWANLNLPTLDSMQYTIAKTIDKSHPTGSVVIHLTKGAKTKDVTLTINYVDADQAQVNAVETLFTGVSFTTDQDLKKISSPVTFDESAFNTLGQATKNGQTFTWPTPTQLGGVEIKYTRSAVNQTNKNGTVDLTFKLNGATGSVTGLDLTYDNPDKEAVTNAAQAFYGVSIATDHPISAVTVATGLTAKIFTDLGTITKTGGSFTFPDLTTAGIKATYTIPTAIAATAGATGTIQMTFTKNGETANAIVNIAYNDAHEKAVAAAKAAFNGVSITRPTILSAKTAPAELNQAAFTALGTATKAGKAFAFPDISNLDSVTYTNTAVTTSAPGQVNITFKAGSVTDSVTLTITYNNPDQNAVDKAAQAFTGVSIVTDHAIPADTSGKTLTAKIFTDLGTITKTGGSFAFPDLTTAGIAATFEIPTEIKATAGSKGTIEMSFVKNGKNATASVNITYDDSHKAAVAAAKAAFTGVSITRPTILSAKTAPAELNQAAFTALGTATKAGKAFAFPDISNLDSVTYTNTAVTTSAPGQVNITFKAGSVTDSVTLTITYNNPDQNAVDKAAQAFDNIASITTSVDVPAVAAGTTLTQDLFNKLGQPQEKGGGFTWPTALLNGITLTYEIPQEIGPSHKADSVEITFTKNGKTATKDITINYDGTAKGEVVAAAALFANVYITTDQNGTAVPTATTLDKTAFEGLGNAHNQDGSTFTYPASALAGLNVTYKVPSAVTESNPNVSVEIEFEKNGATASVSIDLTFTKVIVNAGTQSFKSSNTATTVELQKGLDKAIEFYAPLETSDISPNNPVGPNSGIAHNYSGAIGIINSIYQDLLQSSLSGDNTTVMENLAYILRAFLLNKEILTNNSTQNLNTQATAQELFDSIYNAGTTKLASQDFQILTTLTFKVGPSVGKPVLIQYKSGAVSLIANP